MPNMDKVPGIEFPKSREQLTLLLMRWSALRQQGLDPHTHAELRDLTLVLAKASSQQRDYEKRRQALAAAAAAAKQQRAAKQPSAAPIDAPVLALRLLSRNLDLSESLQAELVALAGEPAGSDAPADAAADQSQQVDPALPVPFRTREARLGLVAKPSAAVGKGAETVIRNRLSHRVAELEHLPANIGTVDVETPSYEPPDALGDGVDALKVKALLELKQLRLLAKQKSMRQHLVYHAAAVDDPVSSSMLTRLFNRRVKMPSMQDLQLTENLERQQRFEQEQRERATRMKFYSGALKHAQAAAQTVQARQARRQQLVKSVLQVHALVEREEAKRAERSAKQRLAALRANDEDAYIKLLDQTKDTRITHLLRQTNSFLDSLSQAVRLQQQESGGPAVAETAEQDKEKIDYYEVAHRVKETITEQPKILVGGKLKEYQLKGLQWMVSLVNNNLNGILADEMGLGKTIQSISLISYLIEVKKWSGPFLVIVPLSTMTNWNVEFDKWLPSVKKVVYKGPPNTRKALQGTIRAGDFQVLLTTYEYIIKDRPLLSKMRWQHMIIDEGHRMKNTQSKLSSTLTQYYHSRHRLILTGTPLQNNLPELWALLNFVLPKIFNSVKTFDEWFNTPFANTGGQDRMELTEEETLLIIRRLHKVLRPFLLRRLKKDVEKDLPDKVEKVIKCKMSALQQKLYEHMLKHNMLYVGAPTDPSAPRVGIRGLNNKIMQLRKICNHPYVFPEVEDMINPSRVNDDQLWRTAGKFELLDRILPKFQATGHRVLLFFQMTNIMNIMEDYLRFKGVQYLRLDGATKADERSEMLKAFNAPDSPYFCFLLSTRAGGLGLNLQTADTVIIYDTDWNPFQDLQAQDRAHRIGQTREVRILRLITEESVEEAILDRALAKLEIDGKVIQAGKFDNKSTAEEQEAFLRSLMESEDQRRDENNNGNGNDDDDMDDDELNSVLARSEDEEVVFRKLDEERALQPYGNKNRLFSIEELPEIYKQDIVEPEPVKVETAEHTPEFYPHRRTRRAVVYDDGLTEDQWLQQMEEEEEEQKRARKGKRAGDRETATPEPKRPKVDLLTPTERSEFVAVADQLWQQLLEATTPIENADEEPRLRAGVFLKLPSKRELPHYYKVITQPISLHEIRKAVDNNEYNSVEELKEAFDLMFNNARTYNPEGSWVYEDAEVLQSIVDSVL